MTDPILDPHAVARLHRIGGTRLLRAMLDAFVDNGEAKVAAARAAADAGAGSALSDAAHALKSSAGNVGATTLQLVAQKVERESKEEGADLRLLAGELADAFVHARAAASAARADASDD